MTVTAVLGEGRFYDDEVRWMREANCRNAPLDIFIAPSVDDALDADVDIDGGYQYPTAEATAYCEPCPVRAECLAWALKNDAVGVWANTSDYQRSLLARKQSRKRCPSCSSNMIITRGTSEICLPCGVSWFARSPLSTVEEDDSGGQ